MPVDWPQGYAKKSEALLGALAIGLLCGLSWFVTGLRFNGQTVVRGVDPRPFGDAASMLTGSPVRPFDAQGEALLAQVATLIAEGTDPVLGAARQRLWELEPYRRDERVTAAMSQWADRLSQPADGTAEPRLFAQANECYRGRGTAGSYPGMPPPVASRRAVEPLSQACDLYGQVLTAQRHHLDARNNLALCEMHQGHDLAAELHLQIVHRVRPDYLPAMINLTVVQQRLGLTAQAREAAAVAYRTHQRSPHATFNAAWYAQADDHPQTAWLLLRRSAKSGGDQFGMYGPMMKLVGQQVGREPLPGRSGLPITVGNLGRAGVSGLLGWTRNWMGATGVAVVFVMIWCAVTHYLATWSERELYGARRRRVAAIYTGCVAAAFVLVWGLACGWWLALLVVCSGAGWWLCVD